MADPFASAFSSLASGASSFGGAVSDIFASEGARSKAQGDFMEAGNYDLAAKYAEQEAQYVKVSTAVQEYQQSRELYKSLGQTTSGVAGAGFSEGGSALDLLRESASQGAMAHAILSQQGLIQEQSYEEQAQSFRNLEAAADMAGNAEKKAGFGDLISAGIEGVAGLTKGASGAMALAALL